MNGLVSDNKQETSDGQQVQSFKSEKIAEKFSNPKGIFQKTPKLKKSNTRSVSERSLTVALAIDGQDESEAQSKIDEILTKSDGIITCTACGKTGTHPGNMRKHVQIHVEGLSYSCPICNRSFRSKNSLQCHNGVFHKIQ